MRKSSCLLAVSSTLLMLPIFVGCQSSGSSTGPGTSNGTWDTSWTFSSRLVGTDRIAIDRPGSVSSFCTTTGTYDSGVYTSVPAISFDTFPARTDTNYFRIQGTTLLLTRADTNRLSSGTKLVYWEKATRVSGTGLFGSWDFTYGDSIEVVGTSVPSDSVPRSRAQQQNLALAVSQSGAIYQATFSATSSLYQIHYGNQAMLEAAEAPLDWSLPTSIHVQATSPTTVVYTGAINGEVVTLTEVSRGVIRYSSSDPAHVTYTQYDSPSNLSQCPADQWFWTFISANENGSGLGRVDIRASQQPARAKTRQQAQMRWGGRGI